MDITMAADIDNTHSSQVATPDTREPRWSDRRCRHDSIAVYEIATTLNFGSRQVPASRWDHWCDGSGVPT